MSNYSNDAYSLSDLLSEEEKNSEFYLKGKIDDIISRLYHSKTDLTENYNYLAGKRSVNKNQWIFDMQGIEHPYDIPFVSLIRPRFNVLMGIQLDHPINYKVTTIGEDSIMEEQEERKNYALNKIFNDVNEANLDLLKQLNHLITVKDGKLVAPKSKIVERALNHINYAYGEDFSVTLQRLCNHVLNYYIYTKDLKFIILDLFKHLLAGGEVAYKINIEEKGADPEIEVLNLLNFYLPESYEGQQISKAPEAFYIKYMTKVEVINTFGHNLDDEERENLYFNLSEMYTNSDYTIGDSLDLNQISPGQTHNTQKSTDGYIPVYYVEWLATNVVEVAEKYISNGKEETRIVKKYRMDRYEGVRIGSGSNLYFNMKKSDNVVRSVGSPYKCGLSFNGIAFSKFNSKAYSMVASLMDVQDQSDINYYIRETILARSHGGGVEIDIASIPEFLIPPDGNELGGVYEVIAMLKNGAKLIDSSQEGVREGGQYGGGQYQPNINGEVIAAFDAVIAGYDNIASEITGVNRQMLGQYQERDGAAVTKQALAQSSLQTKEWFAVLDRVVGWLLSDLLNACRYSYSEGKRGQYLLGNKKEIFNISKGFKASDFNVVIEDGNKDTLGLQKLEQLAMSLIQNQQLDTKGVMKILRAKSLSEAEYTVLKSIAEKEGEGANAAQLQSENEELKKQLEDLQKQITDKEKLDVELRMREQDRKDKETKIKEDKLRYETMVSSRKVDVEEKENETKEEARKRRDNIEAEEAQNGGRTKEVRNIRI